MSLRSRLLLVTVLLVAAGLVAANVATYALLRSSLYGRVDEQLEGTREQATRTLFEGQYGPGPRGGHNEDKGAALPVTYAAWVDGSGKLVAERTFGFGEIGSPPKLPSDLPGSASADGGGSSLIFTAGAEEGSSRYRVLATALSERSGTIVVAFPLDDADATLRNLVLVEGLVTVLVLGAAAGLALWLVRVGFRPLAQMETTAADIAAGDLSRRVEHAGGRTEVGRLGGALNVMLEKIEAAFDERRASEERLRRFVADASHELRTPLTSIRGYAELFRHGAASRPADLAKSMRRIEEESTRMGELVDELLLLARLDQGRPLDRAPVDVTKIALDAVEDARAVQSDRPIDFATTEAQLIEGDQARLRQVAANLLSNALTHTPPRTPVHVRVSGDSDRVLFEVADEGPGLSPEQVERIFDRFFRADPARSRDRGNVGLGLSIAAAIVEAHGGRISVDSTPGRETRFVVSLPRRASPVLP
jgi:two-component system OmpR family sensor kinase